jgi:hypothetical protein
MVHGREHGFEYRARHICCLFFSFRHYVTWAVHALWTALGWFLVTRCYAELRYMARFFLPAIGRTHNTGREGGGDEFTCLWGRLVEKYSDVDWRPGRRKAAERATWGRITEGLLCEPVASHPVRPWGGLGLVRAINSSSGCSWYFFYSILVLLRGRYPDAPLNAGDSGRFVYMYMGYVCGLLWCGSWLTC